MFNLESLKNDAPKNNRYERRIAKLVSSGKEVARIKGVVDSAISNIKSGQKSFVIYGEPQSGKTELMIALTAKLLDENHQVIVALMNDSVQLLGQNLERFQLSGLSPSPKKFNEILSKDIKISGQQWVVFCKKNSQDLKKLIDKLGPKVRAVVLDDEADYATPNSKINKREKSKINELTGQLLGKEGIYIGVTATPARLDLNRTHENQNEHWIDFPPHEDYTGQDVFFPVNVSNLPYKLTLLPDHGDNPKYLREAFFSFAVNVGYLNSQLNEPDENYSLLIHTSGKKADHAVEYVQMLKIFEALKDNDNKNHGPYLQSIWLLAKQRYPGYENVITQYVIANCDRNNLVVMNSDKEVNAAGNRTATHPTAPFTVVIGGNIVSRGVTFNNLLSMFFTRDVKHKLQQDTYIQRARMFGSRGSYLNYFELIIPNELYLDWQKCFIFHRLSLESRKQDKRSPVWLDGERIAAVSSSSIDKTTVVIDSGEMSFAIFEYDSKEIAEIIKNASTPIQKIKALSELLGKEKLPPYLITFIESFCPDGHESVVVHEPLSIAGYTDKKGEVDKAAITRKRGFMGNDQLKLKNYPKAIHHLRIIYNQNGRARVFYKYQGSIRFLKTNKND